MLGAITGDIAGSIHEGRGPVPMDAPLFVERSRFTDDTVLTVAVARAVRCGVGYKESLLAWGRRYPRAGYGGGFRAWLHDPVPYGSFGNGSAMRVSPIGWAFGTLDDVLREARASAAVSHDHPEGIKGAEAVAGAVFLARTGSSMEEIAELLSGRFAYDLAVPLDEFRRRGFNVTCQGTVPAAAVAFLQSTGFENALRLALSLGGDADTLACITGALAEPFYGGVPDSLRAGALARLDAALTEELTAFTRQFCGARRATRP